MAIREIRVVPDPVLRTPCDEIKEITPAVRRLVDDLLETVDDPGRAGLSANQIGVSLRAFSYNIDGKVGYVLNPVLEEKSGEQYGDEGCLSVPGLWYKTRRPSMPVCVALIWTARKSCSRALALWVVCFNMNAITLTDTFTWIASKRKSVALP